MPKRNRQQCQARKERAEWRARRQELGLLSGRQVRLDNRARRLNIPLIQGLEKARAAEQAAQAVEEERIKRLAEKRNRW